ncbi:MAG: rod shape-determining protein MreC [Myxococcota bacterium]
MSANLKDPSDAHVIDRLILQASAPVQYVATEVARSVSGLVEDYVFLIDVKRDHDRLRRELGRLREENRRLQVQARQNQRLRELLQLRERIGGETVSALIIGKEILPSFRVVRVRLDRGARDRIKRGMPVVASDGLVGQVHRTWARYSDVLLTVDPRSAVDVHVPRTGARGVLRGTGDSDTYLCRVQYLQRSDEVKVGDEVYTSGLGQRFPASILVGTITKVERQDFGLYQQVEVAPAVSFSSLEEVLILTRGSRRHGVVEGDGLTGEDLVAEEQAP